MWSSEGGLVSTFSRCNGGKVGFVHGDINRLDDADAYLY